MIDFFISYAREDGDYARAVAEGLRTNGWTVWIDEEDIPASVPWASEIEHAITQSVIFLGFSSSHWQSSLACLIEAEFASRVTTTIVSIDPDRLTPIEAVGEAIRQIRNLPQWKLTAMQLTSAASTWDEGGRRPALLARGRMLRAFRRMGRQYPDELTQVARPFLRASATRHLRRATIAILAAVVVPIMVIAMLSAQALVQKVDEEVAENVATMGRLANANQMRAWNPYLGGAMTPTNAETSFLSYLAAFASFSEILPETWVPKTQATANAELTSAVSPDGTRVAEIDQSSIVMSSMTVPDARSRFVITAPATSVAWSPDGRWVAVGADTGVDVVSSATGAGFRLRGIVGTVRSVGWIDATHIAASTDDGVATWTVFPSKEVVVLPDGVRYGRVLDERLATVDANGTLRLTELRSGKIASDSRSLPTPDISPVGLDAMGAVIAVAFLGDSGGVLRLYDAATLDSNDVDLGECGPNGVSISPDQSTVFLSCIGSGGVTMARVSVSDGTVQTAKRDITLTGVRALDEVVLWASWSGGAWQSSWDMASPAFAFIAGCGVPTRGFELASSGSVFPIGDGTGTFSCTIEGTREDGRWVIHRLIGSSDDGHAAPTAAVSPNGDLIAYGYSNGRVRVFTTKNFYPVFAAPLVPGQVRAMGFLDDETLALAGEDGQVLTVDLQFSSEESAATGIMSALRERLQRAVDIGLYNPHVMEYE